MDWEFGFKIIKAGPLCSDLLFLTALTSTVFIVNESRKWWELKRPLLSQQTGMNHAMADLPLTITEAKTM